MAIGNVTASIEMGSGGLCKLTDDSISPDTRTQLNLYQALNRSSA